MKKYYYSHNDQNLGPFSISELKEKNIYPETMIWYEGIDDWVRADSLKELKPLFKSDLSNSNVKSNKTWPYLAAIFFLISLCFYLYFTNNAVNRNEAEQIQNLESTYSGPEEQSIIEQLQTTETFNYNKVEPLAFARSGHINMGESLDLSVMVAAYDSTEIPKIKYGINTDTVPENWKEATGKIKLPGDSPGEYKVKGQIGVKGRSGLEWKNWSFRYTVGKPSGTVSLSKMNVLYRGYDNEVIGAVQGYTGYNLSMTNGSISKKGEYWIAKPGNGRECSISISGIAEDGSSANVGTFKYRVSNLPAPNINLGNIVNGNSSTASAIKGQSRLFAKYPPEIPLEAAFKIKKYEVFVSGLNSSAKGNGNVLDNNAKSKLKMATKGGTVVIKTTVIYPNGSEWKLSGTYFVE